MSEPNLFEALKPSQKLGARLTKKRTEPHELKQFFRSRSIPQFKLAQHMGVTEATISNWLTGKYPIPDNREAELLELRKKILAWEKRRGRKWNEPPP
jgi:DNA-binding transcriptional regulator YiaG